MKNSNNLHFLLFLGNQKVVVLRDKDSVQLFASKEDKQQVSPQRVIAALSTK